MSYLIHYGIKGMKWGVRRYQNADGSLTDAGRQRYSRNSVFISGSSKTQDKNSGYYRKALPKNVKDEIDSYIERGDKILVGDAPGIDGNFIKKYNHSTNKTYESAQNELSKLFNTFTERALVDQDLKRIFLKYDKDELRFMDEIDVSSLYPNIEIHSFKIIKN